MNVLEWKNLHHKYPESAEQLSFHDWSLPAGRHSLIMGPSGSGKTTLLHLLAGLMRPTGGFLRIVGTDIAQLSQTNLDKFRGQHIGIIFQRPHLVRSLTVMENLQLIATLNRKGKQNERIEQLALRLGIMPILKKKTSQISQGQAMRVAIARAVLNQPLLLLADEPTASLDDQNCERVANLLLEEATLLNASLVIATHDARLKTVFPNPYTI